MEAGGAVANLLLQQQQPQLKSALRQRPRGVPAPGRELHLPQASLQQLDPVLETQVARELPLLQPSTLVSSLASCFGAVLKLLLCSPGVQI